MLCPFWHTEKGKKAPNPFFKGGQVVERLAFKFVKGGGKKNSTAFQQPVPPDPLDDLKVDEPVKNPVQVPPGHR